MTQANIQTSLSNSNPDIRRFLGLEGDLGEQLGLPNEFNLFSSMEMNKELARNLTIQMQRTDEATDSGFEVTRRR